MTTKEIAEAAGTSTDTVARKIKELYPDKMQARRRTELTQVQAIAVMSAIRKEGFVSVPQNAAELPQSAEARFARLETLVAAQIGLVEKLIMLQSAKTPQPQIEAPPLATRDELRRIVNKIGAASGDYSGAWNLLYQEVYYRMHRNVKECAKNRGMDTLDYVESEGILAEVVAIARDIVR